MSHTLKVFSDIANKTLPSIITYSNASGCFCSRKERSYGRSKRSYIMHVRIASVELETAWYSKVNGTVRSKYSQEAYKNVTDSSLKAYTCHLIILPKIGLHQPGSCLHQRTNFAKVATVGLGKVALSAVLLDETILMSYFQWLWKVVIPSGINTVVFCKLRDCSQNPILPSLRGHPFHHFLKHTNEIPLRTNDFLKDQTLRHI